MTDPQSESNVNDFSPPSKSELTSEQKIRIEENRRKALELKRKRIEEQPTLSTKNGELSINFQQCTKLTVKKKLIDTGGGFLLDEDEIEKNTQEVSIVARAPAILPPDQPKCLECLKDFAGSYLLEKFDYAVCDNCRDPEEKHALITKTEAKKNYLLTDVDLEQRGTPLKFTLGQNPHNSRWNDMKLYLQLQVEKRALEIWQSEDKLLEELDKREEKRNKTKQKTYQKKMKALKMSVRSSLYTRSLTENHVHQFGEETYNSVDDTYSHTCVTCPFTETFEKM